VPFKVVANIAYPDRFRIDADMPGGRVGQVYAGGRFWVIDPAGKVDELPEEGRPEIKASIQRDLIAILIQAAAGTLVVREVDSDVPVLAGLEITGPDRRPDTMFINRDNGLVDRLRYEGVEGRIEERFSDYRTVDGIQIPFHTIVRRPRMTSIEREIKTIRFNVPLAPGLFERPK
jgi:hypothetical protein